MHHVLPFVRDLCHVLAVVGLKSTIQLLCLTSNEQPQKTHGCLFPPSFKVPHFWSHSAREVLPRFRDAQCHPAFASFLPVAIKEQPRPSKRALLEQIVQDPSRNCGIIFFTTKLRQAGRVRQSSNSMGKADSTARIRSSVREKQGPQQHTLGQTPCKAGL